MLVPFLESTRLLVTCTVTVSPQSANRVGPGMVLKDRQRAQNQECPAAYPFTAIAERDTPSGATVTSSRVSQYSLVTPVSGTSVVIRQLSGL
jgi:hypothetical protein